MKKELNVQAEAIRQLLRRLKNTTARFQPMQRISIGESSLLQELYSKEQEGASVKPTDLSDVMNISKPAVSRILNIAEEKEYIERFSVKRDRRTVYIRLTDLGKEVLSEEMEEYGRILDRIIDRMGEDEMAAFTGSCNKFCDILLDIMDEQEQEA